MFKRVFLVVTSKQLKHRFGSVDNKYKFVSVVQTNARVVGLDVFKYKII